MSDSSIQFRKEALEIQDHLTKLNDLTLEDDPVSLTVTLPLIDIHGQFIDEYKIKIVPTENYPNEFPFVYELNGRLPKNIDWHVYPDGHLCIKTISEEMLICYKGISLDFFIKEQVTPYFFNQKFRELNGYFLNERSHGNEGDLEFFNDLFRTKDKEVIMKCLKFIANKKQPSRTSSCFCGSGLKYRKCHRDVYKKLSSLPDEYLSFYKRVLQLYMFE